MASHRIDMAVQVTDASTLWQAAAQIAMADGVMTMDDVVETIGPMDCPEVDQCLMLLLDPSRMPGCIVEQLSCTAADAGDAAVEPGSVLSALAVAPTVSPVPDLAAPAMQRLWRAGIARIRSPEPGLDTLLAGDDGRLGVRSTGQAVSADTLTSRTELTAASR